MKNIMTPVTETYIQIGKVIRDIFLCDLNLPENAKKKLVSINGTTAADKIMWVIKMKKYIGLIIPCPGNGVCPTKL